MHIAKITKMLWNTVFSLPLEEEGNYSKKKKNKRGRHRLREKEGKITNSLEEGESRNTNLELQ